MSHRHGHLFPGVPERGLSIQEQVRRIAQAVNGMHDGEFSNTLIVTLEANATVTELVEPRVKPGTVLLLFPQTEAAAQFIANIWSVASTGKITIHHNAHPSTDRKFGVVFFGAGAAA